jgi:hypothetical protein
VFLKENPEVLEKIEAEVREKLGVKPRAAAKEDSR